MWIFFFLQEEEAVCKHEWTSQPQGKVIWQRAEESITSAKNTQISWRLFFNHVLHFSNVLLIWSSQHEPVTWIIIIFMQTVMWFPLLQSLTHFLKSLTTDVWPNLPRKHSYPNITNNVSRRNNLFLCPISANDF